MRGILVGRALARANTYENTRSRWVPAWSRSAVRRLVVVPSGCLHFDASMPCGSSFRCAAAALTLTPLQGHATVEGVQMGIVVSGQSSGLDKLSRDLVGRDRAIPMFSRDQFERDRDITICEVPLLDGNGNPTVSRDRTMNPNAVKSRGKRLEDCPDLVVVIFLRSEQYRNEHRPKVTAG